MVHFQYCALSPRRLNLRVTRCEQIADGDRSFAESIPLTAGIAAGQSDRCEFDRCQLCDQIVASFQLLQT